MLIIKVMDHVFPNIKLVLNMYPCYVHKTDNIDINGGRSKGWYLIY